MDKFLTMQVKISLLEYPALYMHLTAIGNHIARGKVFKQLAEDHLKGIATLGSHAGIHTSQSSLALPQTADHYRAPELVSTQADEPGEQRIEDLSALHDSYL
jgi:hypothetical protein